MSTYRFSETYTGDYVWIHENEEILAREEMKMVSEGSYGVCSSQFEKECACLTFRLREDL